MTKLQVALDLIEIVPAKKLIGELENYIDIIEVGTPFLIRYGLEAVRRMKQLHPKLQVLCDGKIMDAGLCEASEMFEAGADWVTVMACTDDDTISQCCKAARQFGGNVMADMLCAGEVESVVRRLERLGVDCAAIHVGVDQQARGITPLQMLTELRACSPKCKIAVAGGITAQTVSEYLKLQPDILIVGGGILESADPKSAALNIRKAIDQGSSL